MPAPLPPILMYHSVSPSTLPDPYALRVHPDRLDSQLRTLRRLGLRGVSVGELLQARARGGGARMVALTFDDGYVDFLTEALPILERYRMTSTVYVVAGRLARQNDWDDGPRLDLLSADQVREVAAAGHEIGSHSLTHPHMAGLDPAQLREETATSREILEDVLGGPVPGFCYPYGDWDDAAAQAVRDAGYDHACVVKDYSRADRFTVPRFYVGQRDDALRLGVKLAVHRVRRAPAGVEPL